MLEKSGFNFETDLLIQIGDIVDRGPEPFECMDVLLKVKNLVLIKGNHDIAFREFMNGKRNPLVGFGYDNGVTPTNLAWAKLTGEEKARYKAEIFDKQRDYYITKDNIMFVHGGFDRTEKLDDQNEYSFTWDRELVNEAYNCKPEEKLEFLYSFKKVYIGHTPTLYYGHLTPIDRGGVCNIDTGSGKGGPLTIMDIDTGEYWQSDYSDQIKEYVILEKNKKTEGEEAEEGNGESSPQRIAA